MGDDCPIKRLSRLDAQTSGVLPIAMAPEESGEGVESDASSLLLG